MIDMNTKRFEFDHRKRRISRYQPRINRLQRLYEGNFRLLQHLLPAQIVETHSISYVIGKQCFTINLLEETAYTLLVGLSLHSVYRLQQLPEQGLIPKPLTSKPFHFQFTTLYVRIYFDANLAEVISTDKRSVLKGRYDYPNESLLQPDEKEQANQFLADWLRTCVLMGKQI